MTFGQLEHLLIEQGFSKVLSNLAEFTFFFRRENAYVNVLHIIDYKQGLYITQDQYEHIKEKIRLFFRERGTGEVHILSIIISEDIEKAKQLCGGDTFCWLIDSKQNRLLIYENQNPDFYGMKSILENFLCRIASQPSTEQDTTAYTGAQSSREKWNAAKEVMESSGANVVLVILNVISFIICTFTGDLLYNIGAFSVVNLIEDGEWYRIFTSMFLHADIGHLFSNMLILYYIGNVVEKRLRHLSYVLLYFLSGLAGNIFSAGFELFTGDYVSSVGASGAVFGVEGALLMLALLHKGKLAGITTGRIVFSIAFSLYNGFTSSYVNNAAHVGGVLMGFVAAGICWLLLPEMRKE